MNPTIICRTLLFFCILFSFTTIAQTQNEPLNNTAIRTENNQWKINVLLFPSVDYERGISANSTLGINLGTELLFSTDPNEDSSELAGLFLLVRPYYRCYYNFQRRIRKGKNIGNNTGNYVGINATYFYIKEPLIKTEAIISNDYILIPSVSYGFQRTYWKKLNFGLELGLGYAFQETKNQLWPSLNLNLGWIL